jgi:hypothetical protein
MLKHYKMNMSIILCIFFLKKREVTLYRLDKGSSGEGAKAPLIYKN